MKKLLLLILASCVLLAVGCENAAQTTTSQEMTTAETTPTTAEQTTTAEMTTTLPDGLLYWDFTDPEAVESMQESLRQEAIESINAIPREEKMQFTIPKMSWTSAMN